MSIHNDQKGTFESKVFKQMFHILEVKKTHRSPKRPTVYGQSERFNRTLIKMIKAYLTNEQDECDFNIGCLACAHRSTPNASTTLTPNFLCMGNSTSCRFNLWYMKFLQGATRVCTACRRKMLHAHDVARGHIQTSA